MLRLTDLSLRKGEFTLGKLSLEVSDQSYFVILGRSGSGKTMLLESIAGLHDIEGQIEYDGVDISQQFPENRDFGFVYQDFALFDHLRVKQNICFAQRFKDIPDAKNLFADIVEFLDIGSLLERKISHLSGGEKQRVAIARAIYSRPKLLLLDEPLSAVDPTFRTSIMKSLKQIVSRYQISIIHVTHNFREATYLADTIAVMLDGKILQLGKAQEVLNRPNSVEVAKFLGFKNILPARMIGGKSGRFFSINPSAIRFAHNKSGRGHCFECVIHKIISQADYHKVIAHIGKLQIYAKISRDLFGQLQLREDAFYYACIDQEDAIII